VIITGGIDLSIGSVVGLVAVVLIHLFETGRHGSMECDWNCSFYPLTPYRTASRDIDHQSKGSTLCGDALWTACLSEAWVAGLRIINQSVRCRWRSDAGYAKTWNRFSTLILYLAEKLQLVHFNLPTPAIFLLSPFDCSRNLF
jgi:ribose/xylose/arabinose/galactoside ABC-type transport system permease subunit